jgi:hypothetical protein
MEVNTLDESILKKAIQALSVVIKYYPNHKLALIIYDDLIKGIQYE